MSLTINHAVPFCRPLSLPDMSKAGYSASVIDAPTFSVSVAGEPRVLDVAQVLHQLSIGEELEFTGLRPHQHHAWHAFLVQLGAMVAHKTDRPDLGLTSEEWRQALVDLTDGVEESWCLVVEDLAKPAFLQPPVPEGSLDGFKSPLGTPDALDVLVTAKNHDEKRERMVAPQLDHWVYALLTLQTMEGFLGRGNFGIARMNGGFSSRPGIGFAPDLSWSGRFGRDVAVWLEWRVDLCSTYGYQETGGVELLWTIPWDGESSLNLQNCDPFFIEVCRRVRLAADGDRLVASAGNTSCSRLAAKDLRGDTGDVWTPISADGKALTVSAGGFSYRLMADLLLSEDYPQHPALTIREEDGSEPIAVAKVLVRGQGQTDGYHQRVIPIPKKVRLKLGSPEERATLGQLAQARIDRAGSAWKRVLRVAVCCLLQDGTSKFDYRDQRLEQWSRRLDRAIDEVFFERLWADAGRPTLQANLNWDVVLRRLAEETLFQAIDAAPTPASRRPRAVARAELMFYRLARKHLEGAFTRVEEDGETVQ